MNRIRSHSIGQQSNPPEVPRPIKRLLVAASELGVLVLGVAFSLFLVVATAHYFDSRGNVETWAGNVVAGVFLAGLVLTGVGFVAIRRKTRPWKLEYDAVGWAHTRVERRLHPARARRKRIVHQSLVWVPSAIAALVLFFYPAATHLAYPYSGHVGRYRVPIPWTYTIARLASEKDYGWVIVIFRSTGRGRFGMTPFLVWPFWNTPDSLSSIYFDTNKNAPALDPMTMEARRKEAAEVREFRTRDVALTCWQYRRPKASGELPKPSAGWAPEWWLAWNADCDTSTVVHQQYLHVHFYGGEEDLRGFYKIIEGVTSVD